MSPEAKGDITLAFLRETSTLAKKMAIFSLLYDHTVFQIVVDHSQLTITYCNTEIFCRRFNEEPAMIIDGAAGGETKRRHDVTFPLLTLHRGKDCVHFSTGFRTKNR
jgi:hypothetical protein